MNAAAQIIFSTDASLHESADTLRIMAPKSYAGALTGGGRLLWTTLLGGAGTKSWCIAGRGRIICAAVHEGEGELFVFNPANGVALHFRRLAAHIIPKTLCAPGAETK